MSMQMPARSDLGATLQGLIQQYGVGQVQEIIQQQLQRQELLDQQSQLQSSLAAWQTQQSQLAQEYNAGLQTLETLKVEQANEETFLRSLLSGSSAS